MKIFPDITFLNYINKSKIYFYSHLKGIGIKDFRSFRYFAQGFIAQEQIRRSLSIIVEIINSQNFENQGIMIIGQSGVGKTSLAFGISCSINQKIPFVKINGSEINSPFISKIEIINQAIRKSIGILFYQESILIRGEVVHIQESFQSRLKKKILNAKLILKTNEIQSIYEIGPNILKKIKENNIQKGDNIIINKKNGDIYSFRKSISENILENFPTSFKNTRSNSLEKYNVIEYFLTLFELDFINFSNRIISNIFNDFEFEIPVFIRNKIDNFVISWEKNFRIKIIKGIFFIDDINLLDQDCFIFLSKAMEVYMAPFFFFNAKFF
jgi:RuvB-like protein 2